MNILVIEPKRVLSRAMINCLTRSPSSQLDLVTITNNEADAIMALCSKQYEVVSLTDTFPRGGGWQPAVLGIGINFLRTVDKIGCIAQIIFCSDDPYFVDQAAELTVDGKKVIARQWTIIESNVDQLTIPRWGELCLSFRK